MIQDSGATEHFKKMGYDADPVLFKYLAAAAQKLYADPKIFQNVGGGGAAGRTPSEIRAAITKMQTDAAYNTKEHPGHKAAVEEMAALHQELHSVDKK
jgi:hypothetical protein